MSSTVPTEYRPVAGPGTSTNTKELSRKDETENCEVKKTGHVPDFETMQTTFDLLALEEGKGRKPVFTRALLQRVNINVRRVLG
jgi:hypothetical protein